MLKKIPYGRQWIDGADIKHVVKILKSDFLTQGPLINQFEKKIASYTGAKYGVAFSSGTAALHGASFAAGIMKGDDVITTPMTFAASANCVLYQGGTVVFVDTLPDQPIIDPDKVAKKINSKTKAIISVDFSGLPADYDELQKIAHKNQLVLIADAAHSLGGSYKRKKVGTLADMSVLSFHPVKAITTGEGGMVLTDNAKFYELLTLFRTHGITKNETLLDKKGNGPTYYEMKALGFNYRLTDIQAALGLSQLTKLERFIKRRAEIAELYTKSFEKARTFKTLKTSSDRTSAWHLFPILLNNHLSKKKKEIVEAFHERGIMVQVHYIPIHLHPYYKRRYTFASGDFPNAESFYESEISLPLFPKLTTNEITRVIKVTKEILM